MEVIPEDQLSPQVILWEKERKPAPTYKLRRTPQDINELEEYRGSYILHDNGAVTYLFYHRVVAFHQARRLELAV